MTQATSRRWLWWIIAFIAAPVFVTMTAWLIWRDTSASWVEGGPLVGGTCIASARDCATSQIAATVAVWIGLSWWLWLPVGVVGAVVWWGRDVASTAINNG